MNCQILTYYKVKAEQFGEKTNQNENRLRNEKGVGFEDLGNVVMDATFW